MRSEFEKVPLARIAESEIERLKEFRALMQFDESADYR